MGSEMWPFFVTHNAAFASANDSQFLT